MDVLERFLSYVQVDTQSDEECGDCPSSKIQFNLAKKLKKELIKMGVKDAVCDKNCYVFGHIPATSGYENAPTLGFIAHMDTAPDFNGFGVKPQIVECDGGDVTLKSGRVISKDVFRHLPSLKGEKIVVTDGNSLLGGDDKAGVAEIMTACEYIIENKVPHGRIAVCFTPDEEVGRGADKFPIELFDAKYAYTVDGGPCDEVEYENFNAEGVKIVINGFNVHPGDSKDKMINASLVGMEINALLPEGQTPRDTEGYQGFFHLTDFSGNVEKAEMRYIIRDHDDGSFENRIRIISDVIETVNEKYGKGTAEITLSEQYRNMASIIRQNYHLIENALEAIKAEGLDAKTVPVRGGTDGARLSFMGLPCPNLGTGVYAMHGPCEHAVISQMEKSVKIIISLIKKYIGSIK